MGQMVGLAQGIGSSATAGRLKDDSVQLGRSRAAARRPGDCVVLPDPWPRRWMRRRPGDAPTKVSPTKVSDTSFRGGQYQRATLQV